MSTPHSLRAPGVAILLSEGDDAPAVGHTTWNQIARLGEFRGHPQGACAFTPEVFAELVANFDATLNRCVPVDFEHTSELLPDNAAQEGVPAVAWVTALDDRGAAGLWGAFEWVDAQAVEYVRTKRYRYLSPAISLDATHRESGEKIGARLTSVALTNHPFLDGMAPLTASETTISDTTRCGLSAGDVHIPVGVSVTPRKEPPMSDEKTPDVKKLEMAEPAPAKTAMNPKLSALAPGLGMDAEASEDALLDKLAALVAELQKSQQVEAATMADAVCASGRVSKEGRADLVAMCLSDRAKFLRMFPVEEKPAEKPADLTADAKALLTGRVVDQKQHPATVAESDDSDHMAEAREADALAQKLLSEKKAGDYATAITMASREVRAKRTNAALARLRPTA